jgi:hypothetical protein
MQPTVSHSEARNERTPKRGGWKTAGLGCVTLFVLLLAGGMLGYQYVAYVPPVYAPPHTPPTPNAYDDFHAAVQLLPPIPMRDMAFPAPPERRQLG